MSGKIQMRLAVLAALAALVAVLVPSGLASGTHDPGTNPSDASYSGSGVLQLSMDSNPDQFILDADGNPSTPPSPGEVQGISETRCEVSLSPDPAITPGQGLVTFKAPGFLTNNKGPGFFSDGLGVKSGGAQGVACSRFSGSEVLRMSLHEGQLQGLEVAEAQLDIEVKKGAEVQLKTFFVDSSGSKAVETFYLRSGGSIQAGQGSDPIGGNGAITVSSSANPIANCKDRSDSGPDAGAADNCRWIIRDMTPFNRMELSIKSGNLGEATLEGGADGTVPAPGANPAYGSDSLFYLTDIDGLLTCGDTHTISDPLIDPNLVGVLTVHAMEFDPVGEDWKTTQCLLKAFLDAVGNPAVVGFPSLSFVPDLENTFARYTMVVTLENQPVTTDTSTGPTSGAITSLQAQYNLSGDLSFGPTDDMLSCNGQPIDDPSAAGYTTYWQQDDPVQATDGAGNLIVDGLGNPVPLLPGGETICFYSSSVVLTGVDSDGNPIGTEIWKIYFEDDPGKFF